MDSSSIEDARTLLALYNQKATQLNASSFVTHVRTQRTQFTFAAAPFRVLREGGPTSEAVDAFVLTLRLFLVVRDGLTFPQVRLLYAKLPVPEELQNRVFAICDEVSKYLDGPTVFDFYGERPTKREFFKTWLYGEVAHVNSDKRARLRKWGIDRDTRPLIEREFEAIMVALLQAIFWIRQENIAAMLQLDMQALERTAV